MHLEEGNLFVMLPARGSGTQRRRKISLIERNGLYFLPSLVDVPQCKDKTRMSVACPVVTRSQQRNNLTSPSGNSDESMVGAQKTQEGDGTYEGPGKESRAEEDVGKESGSPMSPQVSIHRNIHGSGASLRL